MSKYAPVKLAYNSYEPTTGKIDEILSPVIFLHGLIGWKEMWFDIPQIISDKTKRRTYTVDARNHGDSEWSDVFNFDINADDLLHFMDTLSIQKAVLIGHSMGGITSIKAALKEPERIEMVFVEDMYAKKITQQVLEAIALFIDTFRCAVEHIPTDCTEKDAPGYIVKYISDRIPQYEREVGNSESSAKITFPLNRDTEGRYLSKTNIDVIQKAVENGDTLMSEPKGSYGGPAYFIYGVASPCLVHEEEEHIRKFFPKAELIGVEDGNHYVHFQFPDKFTEILLKYF